MHDLAGHVQHWLLRTDPMHHKGFVAVAVRPRHAPVRDAPRNHYPVVVLHTLDWAPAEAVPVPVGRSSQSERVARSVAAARQEAAAVQAQEPLDRNRFASGYSGHLIAHYQIHG